MKLCVVDPEHGRQHARSRCFDCWVKLTASEAAAIAKPRRRLAREVKERELFVETRKARLAGDVERRAFILKNRALPEDRASPRKGQKSFRGDSIDRTFVSDIELDNGTGSWLGYDYFGDVQHADWPEREKLGTGGRDTSRIKRK